MNWNSWSEFFAMGGYSLYVWGSVSVVFGFFLTEVVELALRRKNILAKLQVSKLIKKKP